MRRNRFFSVLFALLLLAASGCPAKGLAAHITAQGEAAAGVLAAEGACPLVVEKEVLTFDAQSFPQFYYQDESQFFAYDGQVTAEYSLYNPTQETVTAKLRLPLGTLPEYGSLWVESAAAFYRPDVLDRYSVTVNGQPVETSLRHTFTRVADIYGVPEAYDLDLEADGQKLSDTPIANAVFSPDLSVTKYVYTVKVVYQDPPENEGARSVKAACILPLQPEKSQYLFPYYNFPYIDRGGAVTVTLEADANGVYDDQLVVYVLGEPAEADWEFHDPEGRAVDAAATLLRAEEMTFYDLALTGWDAATGVRAIDWYNAMAALYSERLGQYGVLAGNDLPGLDIAPALMAWYEYELTLAPGERAVHTVTAPIYPTLNKVSDQTIYGYNFLLSPAQTWNGFGTLEVRINTPSYLIVSNLPGFEKTGDGYACSPEAFPGSEIEFVLCERNFTITSDLLEGLYLPDDKENRVRNRLILAAVALLAGGGAWWRRRKHRQQQRGG